MGCKCFAPILFCLLLVGCTPPTIYELEVSPDEDGAMRRALTVTDGEVSDEVLDLYVAAGDTGAEQPYCGQFSTVPQDIGGSGTWKCVASPMGDLYLYAERFRGNDDLAQQIEDRFLATDRVADLLIAWFESELSEDPRWPTLRAFMDTELRHDLKNLSLYVLLLKQQGGIADQWVLTYSARAGQYLADRGYFQEDDLDVVLDLSFFGTSGPDRKWQNGLLQRMAARRMGIETGEPVPESLDFLNISDAIDTSLEDFATSSRCEELVAGWDIEAPDDSSEAPGIDEVVLNVLLAAAGLDFELFSEPDKVKLSLNCLTEPIATYGQWDDKAQMITWEDSVLERFGMPLFFYAYWVEPDTAYQTEHLGAVRLEGDWLAKFAVWYSSLPQEQQARWDGFIESLDPAQRYKGQVAAARETDLQAGDHSLSRGYDLLFNAKP